MRLRKLQRFFLHITMRLTVISHLLEFLTYGIALGRSKVAIYHASTIPPILFRRWYTSPLYLLITARLWCRFPQLKGWQPSQGWYISTFLPFLPFQSTITSLYPSNNPCFVSVKHLLCTCCEFWHLLYCSYLFGFNYSNGSISGSKPARVAAVCRDLDHVALGFTGCGGLKRVAHSAASKWCSYWHLPFADSSWWRTV